VLRAGYADLAIGLGRMLGFRYPENFRRPFTADSLREFWRRWNVKLITWLRDYLSLPIAGQDRPTPRLYLNIVAGFCLVAAWHRFGWSALTCGVYFGTLLALWRASASTTCCSGGPARCALSTCSRWSRLAGCCCAPTALPRPWPI
jgi:alginate O-acetyltransferase complex protein AlgI